MISTSDYITSDTTGYYEDRSSNEYTCNSATCGCRCGGLCAEFLPELEETQEESIKESRKVKIDCQMRVPIPKQYSKGMSTKYFMSHRKGITSKKVKEHAH